MKVKLLTEDATASWNAYVRSHQHGSPFHLTNWSDAISSAFGHKSYYWGVWRGDQICGIMPLTHVKSLLFGNVLSSAAFAAYGGILADDQETANVLLAQGQREAKKLSVDYLELKWQYEFWERLPSNDLYVTFKKELSHDQDENMKAIPRKQRAMVRKGIKSGLRALVGNEYLDAFYDIFCVNVHRLGTPVYSKKWFVELLEQYREMAEVMVIEHEGKIISGVFSFFHGDTVLPYYAASLVDYRKYAPNDFQYWELMRRAVEKGVKYFDYGRSKKGTGQYAFKKNWGFEPSQLHYSYVLNNVSEVPQLNPLNPKYHRKIELWKKIPLSVTKIIGPYLVKNIP